MWLPVVVVGGCFSQGRQQRPVAWHWALPGAGMEETQSCRELHHPQGWARLLCTRQPLTDAEHVVAAPEGSPLSESFNHVCVYI